MATVTSKITPCLWFDSEGEEAARFYVLLFENARLGDIARYSEAGREFHGKEPGTAMTVEFELEGQPFLALNGGPRFKFSEAVSFQIHCETQAEIDHFWARLCEGGEEGPCGWLKDRFGLSWQVVPAMLPRLLKDPDPLKVNRVTDAFMRMKKFDIAALERAHSGQEA